MNDEPKRSRRDLLRSVAATGTGISPAGTAGSLASTDDRAWAVNPLFPEATRAILVQWGTKV